RDLVLESVDEPPDDRAVAGEKLAQAILDDRRLLPLGADEERLLLRIRFLAGAMPETGAAPDAILEQAIREAAAGKLAVDEIGGGDVRTALLRGLPPAIRGALDREAPERLVLPSGRSVAISYAAGKPPAAAARLQELFGLRSTPRL